VGADGLEVTTMNPSSNGHGPTVQIGVVGLGVVGGTIARVFRDAGLAVRGYDAYTGEGSAADLAGSDVVFVCVPTPTSDGGAYELDELWAAVRTTRANVAPGGVIVVKSSVPPGTVDRLTAAFPDYSFASVPEFLTADRPLETFTRPDRVVIGSRDQEVSAMLARLLRLVAPTAPILLMDPVEAELIKLSSNALLAAKVAMANDLAEVCAAFGVDWRRVQSGVGLDRRIGPDHLTVSPERGFGGACLPKDLDGLIAASRQSEYEPQLLAEVARFNWRIRARAARSHSPSAPASDPGAGAHMPRQSERRARTR
jgi:UDPglucose 6-dehydrogenase